MKRAVRPLVVAIPMLLGAFTANLEASYEGSASWYDIETCKANKYEGCPMASGMSLYDALANRVPYCASWDYPFWTVLRIRAVKTGKVAGCIVLDRGPAKRLYRKGRVLDLNPFTFQQLAPLSDGVIEIKVEPVKMAYEAVSSVRG